MAAMSATIATVATSAMADLAKTLSSSAAFGASAGVQRMRAVRSPESFHGSRMMAVMANHSSHQEQAPAKSMLVALVAAGAALALNAAPVSPAHAGLFGSDNVKVERGATAPDFPGNEGTGTKMDSNSGVRGSASSGTPLGEGSLNTDSGNPLNKVGELNPFKGGLPDASNVVGDAKDAVQRKVAGAKDMAENAKSTVDGGLPDPFTAASEVVSSRDVKNAAGQVAKNAAQSVATNSAQEFVEGVKSNIGLPSPMEAGKALMSKVTGN